MSNMEAFNKIMSELGNQLTEETITAIKSELEAKDELVVFNTLASLKHKKTIGPIESAMSNTTPPQRTWVGLTGFEQKELMSMTAREAVFATETKLKEKNT